MTDLPRTPKLLRGSNGPAGATSELGKSAHGPVQTPAFVRVLLQDVVMRSHSISTGSHQSVIVYTYKEVGPNCSVRFLGVASHHHGT